MQHFEANKHLTYYYCQAIQYILNKNNNKKRHFGMNS